MKPETQLRIGRITAIALLVLLLIYPPLFLYVETAGTDVTLKQGIIFLLLNYIIVLPFVSILGGFAWALRQKKQKAAITFFVIIILWFLLILVSDGIRCAQSGRIGCSEVGLLLIIFLIVNLILQGLIGVIKSQKFMGEKYENNS